MKRNHIILILCSVFSCTLFLFLLSPSSVGQDGGESKKGGRDDESAGSGIRALVVQVEGNQTEVEDVQIWKEELGMLSLTQVPTDTFTIKRGRAELKVPFTKIRRIQYDDDKCLIKSIMGGTLEGEVNRNDRFLLKGRIMFGKFEIELRHVRSIELTHPKTTLMSCPSCRRYYVSKDWRFCPYDGAKLKKSE